MNDHSLWRPMEYSDLALASAMGNRIYPDHYERPMVFVERFDLFSSGCFAIQNKEGLIGYAVAYPISLFYPPPLDSLIGRIDPLSDCLYVHDVAILSEWRKRGLGSSAVKLLKELARAKGLLWMSLVSIQGSRPFWERQGFQTFQFVIGDTTSLDRIASQGSGASYMATCRLAKLCG